MKGKIQAGVVCLLIAAIGAFGVVETLQAAPKESQRLRGMEGRAFLVEAFVLDENGNVVGENPPGGSYCYIFNSDAEWIDQRWPGGPGTWEQHSVGAKTPYTASAEAELNIGSEEEPFVTLVSIIQEGTVTPAHGKGVLQLEAVTEVFVAPFGLVQVLLSIGHEVDISECP